MLVSVLLLRTSASHYTDVAHQPGQLSLGRSEQLGYCGLSTGDTHHHIVTL